VRREVGYLGQGLEIVLDQFAPGRQSPRREVDVVLPRGEQPHVPPLLDRRTRRGAGLHHQERQSPFDQVRRAAASPTPCTDHDDRADTPDDPLFIA